MYPTWGLSCDKLFHVSMFLSTQGCAGLAGEMQLLRCGSYWAAFRLGQHECICQGGAVGKDRNKPMSQVVLGSLQQALGRNLAPEHCTNGLNQAEVKIRCYLAWKRVRYKELVSGHPLDSLASSRTVIQNLCSVFNSSASQLRDGAPMAMPVLTHF